MAGEVLEEGLWWESSPPMPVIRRGERVIYFGPAWTSIDLIDINGGENSGR